METHPDVVLLLCLWACVCLPQDQLAEKAPTEEAQRPSHQDHPHIQWHLKIKYDQINMHCCTGHKDMAVYNIRIIKIIVIIITTSSSYISYSFDALNY